MRRVALVLGLAALAAGALAWVVPYLTRDRDYAAVTPQPDPLVRQSTIALPGGAQACMDRAVVDPRSEQARIRVGTFGSPGVPLELTVRGAGYRASARVPGGYADSAPLSVPVQPPARPVEATICIRNLSERRVALYASDDRTNSRSRVRVDGRPVPEDFVVTFYERRPASIADRLPTAFERASAFRPLVAPWILWAVLGLFAVGMPLGILWALVDALPRDRR
jgi:hypothetical protein